MDDRRRVHALNSLVAYRVGIVVDGEEEVAVIAAIDRIVQDLHKPQAAELNAERARVYRRNLIVVE